MSLRIDTAEWISGALLIGDVGGGVLAEALAASGDDGSGFLSDDVTLPADNGKEICGRILTVDSGLSLFAFEDGSLEASAADGVYSASYQLYVDYVPAGSPTTITFTFGSSDISIALGWTEGGEANAITATATAPVDAASPEMVGSLSASSTHSAGFTLTWDSATDNVGVTGYEVSINAGTDWADVGNVLTSARSGLPPSTLFPTRVRAYDAAGNRATPLSLNVTTAAPSGGSFHNVVRGNRSRYLS